MLAGKERQKQLSKTQPPQSCLATKCSERVYEQRLVERRVHALTETNVHVPCSKGVVLHNSSRGHQSRRVCRAVCVIGGRESAPCLWTSSVIPHACKRLFGDRPPASEPSDKKWTCTYSISIVFICFLVSTAVYTMTGSKRRLHAWNEYKRYRHFNRYSSRPGSRAPSFRFPGDSSLSGPPAALLIGPCLVGLVSGRQSVSLFLVTGHSLLCPSQRNTSWHLEASIARCHKRRTSLRCCADKQSKAGAATA